MQGDNQHVPSILGLCNPLLDISAYVEPELLQKYNLKPNNVILAGEEHKDLCKELVEKYNVDYTAGGSAQNVVRVAAGILRRQSVKARVLFSGCISNDAFGDMMSKKAKEDGVETCYSICETEPTGTCAVCLTDQGKNRSLCAFLGASQKFNAKHLRDNWTQLVEKTDIIYISGFLMAVTPETYHLLGDYIAKSKDARRKFCFNLSAPYVSDVFGKEVDKIVPYIDMIFGNDDEALAYAKHRSWTDTKDIVEIAKRLCGEPKQRSEVGRVVVITRGHKPIIVAEQTKDGVQIQEFECEQIPDEQVVDTNGAGDAFAGGFLSQLIQGADLKHCVQMGSYAAREIIKISGIVMPDFADIPQKQK